VDKKTNVPQTAANAGLNKRAQVLRANNSIFLWVAGAAAVVALSAVMLQFLVKQGLFHQKIISELSNTNKILEDNRETATALTDKVKALIADTNLESARANSTDSNLQVILDALPTTGDTTSLSNSLYSQVVSPVGLRVESVIAGSIDGVSVETPNATLDPAQTPTPQTIPFAITTVGNVNQTTNLFKNLERTIRPLNPRTVTIKIADGTLNTTVTGESYFVGASKVDVGKKLVSP
jgi:hypothetical protein